MLVQRRKRWANVVYMFYKCFVFTGMLLNNPILTINAPKWLQDCMLFVENDSNLISDYKNLHLLPGDHKV